VFHPFGCAAAFRADGSYLVMVLPAAWMGKVRRDHFLDRPE
jgi:hypothetical protein